MSRRAFLALTFIVCLVAAVIPGEARGQTWSVDLSAGRTVYEPIALSAGTNNLVGSVRYDPRRDAWVYVNAALPLGDAAPFWDGGGAGGRFFLPDSGLRRLTLGSDVGAHAFMFRDATAEQMGKGGILEAIPFVSIPTGAARIELRGGWRGQSLAFGGTTQHRGVFETGIRGVYDAVVNLQGDVRWVRAAEGVFPFLGASIAYSGSSPVTVWGRTGKWVGNTLTNVSWGVGASVAMGSRSTVWISAQQEAPDPLYWNAERRSWAVGVTRQLTRQAAPIVPTSSAEPGGVLIRLSAADAPAGGISIAGSFNNWQPQPMQREGGEWIIRLPLAPGVYQYAFRSASGEWFVPASTPGRRDDGFGGQQAVLVVS